MDAQLCNLSRPERRLALTLSLMAPLSTHAFEPSFAPTPEVEKLTIAEDGKVTTHFTARDGRFYILWVSEFPDDPGTPIQLRVPPAPGPDTIVFDPSSLPVIPDWLPDQAFFRITNPRTDELTDHDFDGIDDLYEAARTKEAKPDLPPDQWLNPFDYRDADLDPFIDNDSDGMDDDDRKHWEIYLDDLEQSFETGGGQDGWTSSDPPPSNPDLAALLGVNIVNDAASDYTPSFDAIGNVRLDNGIALADPTQAGFQYPGTYYYALRDECELASITKWAFDADYEMGAYGFVSGYDVYFDNWRLQWITEFEDIGYEIDPNTGEVTILRDTGTSGHNSLTWPLWFPDREWPLNDGSWLRYTDAEGNTSAQSSATRALLFVDESGLETPQNQARFALDIRSGLLLGFQQRAGGYDLSALEFELNANEHLGIVEVQISDERDLYRNDHPPFRVPVTILFPNDAFRLLEHYENSAEFNGIYFDSEFNTIERRPLCLRTRSSWPSDSVILRTRRGFSEVPLDHAPANDITDVQASGRMQIGFFSNALALDLPWRRGNSRDDHHPDFVTAEGGQPATDPIAYAAEHSQRVYVATYGSNFPDDPDNYTGDHSAKVVAFPIIENPPTLTLYPAGAQASSATLRTSTADPRTDLRFTKRISGLWNYRRVWPGTPDGYPPVEDPHGDFDHDYQTRARINEILPASGDEGFVELAWRLYWFAGDLGGFYLSDDPDNLTKYQIPAPFPVAAGERALFSFEDLGIQPAPITQIYLTDPDGSTLVDTVVSAIPLDGRSLAKGIVRGENGDDIETWYFDPTPTPLAANETIAPGEMRQRYDGGVSFHMIDADGIDHSAEFADFDWVSEPQVRVNNGDTTWRVWSAGFSNPPTASMSFTNGSYLRNGYSYELEFFSSEDTTVGDPPEVTPEFVPLLAPGDSAIPFDEDSPASSSSPASDGPSNAIDGSIYSTHSNSGAVNAGLILTPALGTSIAEGISITTRWSFTGERFRDLDPVDWELFGTDSPVLTGDHGTGTSEPWTRIASGSFPLAARNGENLGVQQFPNATSFLSYKFVVRSTRSTSATAVSFSEIQLFGKPDNFDASLGVVGLKTLQDLTGHNSNHFGTFTVPPSGITIVDSTLLSDTLTTDGYVGLADGGSQIGTLRFSSIGDAQVRLSTPDGSIDRGGTYPWLRDRSQHAQPNITANYPTGLRAESDDTIDVSEAHLSAHSLELALPYLTLNRSTLISNGGTTADPVSAATYDRDPAGNSLGYIHFSHDTIDAYDNEISAETDLRFNIENNGWFENTQLTARTGDLIANSRSVHFGDDSTLRAANLIWLQGSHPRSSILSIDQLGPNISTTGGERDEIRFDGFSVMFLSGTTLSSRLVRIRLLDEGDWPESTLHNTTIHTTKLARLYANHQLRISGHVTVQNPEIASPGLTVEPGATLELTGDNPRVFANTHNYGHGDFGTLLINGVPQDGSTRRPSFHLRPHFEEE